MPDFILQASPTSFGKSLKLPKLQNTLYTLKRCGLCLGTNLLSSYDNRKGEGEETTKKHTWFFPMVNWSIPLRFLDISHTIYSGELPKSIGKIGRAHV